MREYSSRHASLKWPLLISIVAHAFGFFCLVAAYGPRTVATATTPEQRTVAPHDTIVMDDGQGYVMQPEDQEGFSEEADEESPPVMIPGPNPGLSPLNRV